MAVIETWLHQDADHLVEVVPLKGNLFYEDNGGNLIGVEVTRAGAAVSLPNSCYGYALLSNGSTEFVRGTVSGNRASITLPSACYSQVGPISIVLKVGATLENNFPKGGVTVAACTGYVYRTRTDTIVDPGSVVPGINELLDKIERCEAATLAAEKVNISQSKTGNVITVTTTDRNGQNTSKTLQEPVVTVTPHGGDFDLNVVGANGTQTVTIPNPNKELSDRAHVETVSRAKTRSGNPIVLEDAVEEIADKMVIHLEPKQDLHGYDHPWVGGAGRNLLRYPFSETTVTKNGVTFTDNGDGTITLNTDSNGATAATDFQVIATTDQLPLENGDYILSIIALSGERTEGGSVVYYHAKGDSSESSWTNMVVDFELNQKTIHIINGSFYALTIRVGTVGGVFTNYKVRLMLKKADDESDEWEPYENICPITGYDNVDVVRTGKNLLEFQEHSTDKGLTFIREDDGTLSFSGTTTGACTHYLFSAEEDGVLRGRYIVKIEGDISTTSGGVYLSDANRTRRFSQIRGDCTFITDNGIYKLWLYFSAGVTVSASHLKISVTRDEIEFVPGKYSVYPISISTAASGTVYGGTVTVNRDGSGTLVVDRACITIDGSESYIAAGATAVGALYLNADKITPLAKTMEGDSLSDSYVAVMAENTTYMDDYTVCRQSVSNTRLYLKVSPLANKTAEELKEYFTQHPFQYCGMLTTPQTYTLTATQLQTLLGYNYIYNDGGEMDLTYRQEALVTNDIIRNLLPTGTASGNPVSISDGAEGMPLKKLQMEIVPKQDLHGYDKPWIGGAGKNLFPTFKEPYETSQITTTFNTDGSITLNGTAPSGRVSLPVISDPVTIAAGTTYILTGCPAGGDSSSYRIDIRSTPDALDPEVGSTCEYGSGLTFTPTTTHDVLFCVRIARSYVCNNLTIYPMLRLATETDATYEPYENICPISGWEKVEVHRTGKNLIDYNTLNLAVINDDGLQRYSACISMPGTYACRCNAQIQTSSIVNAVVIEADGLITTKFAFGSSSIYNRTFLATINEGEKLLIYVNTSSIETTKTVLTDAMAQVEFGATSTSYEPPLGIKTYSISIPSEAGTVYGGTLTLDENGEGTLMVDTGRTVWDGTESIIKGSGIKNYYVGIPEASIAEKTASGWLTSSELKQIKLICNLADVADVYDSLSDSMLQASAYCGSSMILQPRIFLPDCSTVEEAKAWLAEQNSAGHPLTWCYLLKNPVTYTLTADQVKTILGSNTISSDAAGTIEVEYYRKLLDAEDIPAPDLSAYATKSYVNNQIMIVEISGIPAGDVDKDITLNGLTSSHKAISIEAKGTEMEVVDDDTPAIGDDESAASETETETFTGYSNANTMASDVEITTTTDGFHLKGKFSEVTTLTVTFVKATVQGVIFDDEYVVEEPVPVEEG